MKDNDLNPFLLSLINKNRDIVTSLIEFISNNTINSTNEYKFTPLHFSCLYNYYELAINLISKGAIINAKSRDKSYTPLDILILNANYEMLELLLNNKKFSILANEKNHINCTPFHKASLESILCAKLLLKYRDNTKDINGNLP